jgi:hypothetical protein
MRASDRPRTLYTGTGTGTLNELVGVAVRASLAFARVGGDGRVTPLTFPVHLVALRSRGAVSEGPIS